MIRRAPNDGARFVPPLDTGYTNPMLEIKKIELSPAVSILLAGALIAGAIIFVNLQSGPAAVADSLPGNTTVPKATAADHIVGDPNAPIVLIEYSDFQCPYCSMVYPTIKRIVDESNGQIAWVMRNLPLDSIHPEARPAGLAAECIAEQAGNKGWWQFADDIFGDQSNLGNARYLAEAGKIGVNITQYISCVSSQKYNDKLDVQSAEAQVAGAQGTPYTLVVGHGASAPLSGALPYAQFAAVIKAVRGRQ
jgi:protein-disulfide isomerase